MSPQRLLAALLLAFVILSGLNYFYYNDRTTAIIARAATETSPLLRGAEPNASIHKVLKQYNADLQAYLAARATDSREAQRGYKHMVFREVVLVVLAIVGVILLARRR